MTISESINYLIIAFIAIFDSVIVARIIKILLDAQINPDQDTAKMVRNRIIVIVVVSCLAVIINKIQTFYK